METLQEYFNKGHWHFEVLAYNNKVNDEKVEEAVEIHIVEAKTEQEAMEIARNKIQRSHYFLRKAFQCKQCGFQEEMLRQMKKPHE